MKIITAEGKIIEGQQVNEEELSIIEELVPEINRVSRRYVAEEDCKLIVHHLISTYFIARRNPVVVAPESSIEVTA